MEFRSITRDAGGAVSGCRREWLTRVSVEVAGRRGSVVQVHGPDPVDLPPLVDAAVSAAAAAETPAGRTIPAVHPPPADRRPRRRELCSLGWLTPGPVERKDVRFSRDTGAGHDEGGWSSHWRTLLLQSRPAARVPVDAPVLAGGTPAVDPGRLLLPPHVLSQLLSEPLTAALLGITSLRRWPRAALRDPAWEGGADYEGTPRRPVCFAVDGALCTGPADRATAARDHRLSTGHAGVGGPLVRDLVVDGGDAGPLPAGLPVIEGTCLSRGADGRNPVFGLRTAALGGRPAETLTVALDDVADLLDCGQWCGPWQRGAGSWTSRWLTMGNPCP
ncbi:MAG TPA: hypothetical protein VE547_13695 [Mycobacteriales bacterium]|nr:hypothetical protein [Mycobacteriales bacterium]